MSKKTKRILLQILSYILTLVLGGGMASCNFMNLYPTIY